MSSAPDCEPGWLGAVIGLTSGIPLASIDPILALSVLPHSLRGDGTFFLIILWRSNRENISSTPSLAPAAPSHQSFQLFSVPPLPPINLSGFFPPATHNPAASSHQFVRLLPTPPPAIPWLPPMPGTRLLPPGSFLALLPGLTVINISLQCISFI